MLLTYPVARTTFTLAEYYACHVKVGFCKAADNHLAAVNIKLNFFGEDIRPKLFRTIAENAVTLSHLRDQDRLADLQSSMQFALCSEAAKMHITGMVSRSAEQVNQGGFLFLGNLQNEIARIWRHSNANQLSVISEEHSVSTCLHSNYEFMLKDRRAFADKLHASNKSFLQKTFSRHTINELVVSGSSEQSLSSFLVSIKTAHESLKAISKQTESSLQKVLSATEKRAAGHLGDRQTDFDYLVVNLNAERVRVDKATGQIAEYSKERKRIEEHMKSLW